MSTSTINLESFLLKNDFASLGYIIGASAATLIVYLAGTVIYNLYFHPLSNYPGPKLYAASIIPQMLLWWNGNEHTASVALHAKYGEVVRMSPDTLSYTGAQAWKDIYGYRPGVKQIPKDAKFYKRPGQTDTIHDIIYSNDADHSRYRRTLANAFSDKALRGSEPILNSYFDLLISKLKERASSPETSVVDLVAFYNWTTFDIIGDLAFGEPFHALANTQYHPYIKNMLDGFPMTTKFRVFRNFHLEKFLLRVVAFTAKFSAQAQKTAKTLQQGYAKEVIARRLSPEVKMQEKKDFMYHVLRQEETKGMSEEELVWNARILILAGSETTATFLSGCTYRLLTNPEALKKLTDEVRNRFKSADEITLASTIASEMPYLHAVIEEGLRMYPPVPSRLPRRTVEGTTIIGKYVPPNISIGIHQLSSSLSPLSYHNPTHFVPERWLASPPEEYRNDHLDGNQPFSMGPRNCLGKNLAYGEMRSILARMVWNFDMYLAEKEEEGKEWTNQKVYTLFVKGPLMVRLKIREGL